MKRHWLPSIILTVCCIVLFVGVYTLGLLGIGQLAPNNGRGRVITHNGQIYFAHMGQKFTEDRYFWSRPSAVDYNAAGSAGSNKGPTNPDYLAVVQERIDTFMAHNPGVERSEIPSDLVTASGSGLDPDISVKAAEVQVPRIARVRGISEQRLRQLIEEQTQPPLLHLFGPERINVLKLNIALDELNQTEQL
jgi:K+-transporting ATPase ATPase C chain